MMNKKVISGILMAIAVILAIIGYIYLPDVVAIQYNFSGEPSNYGSKITAILIPLIFSLLGSWMLVAREEKKASAILFIAIGYVIPVFMLITN